MQHHCHRGKPCPLHSSGVGTDSNQASGNLGRPTVNALLAKKQFKVSALTRVSSSATFPGEVTVIKTDYTHASLVSAFKGQDAIVCTIATSNLTDQKRVIDAAVEAGVKRFIPSEFGWDTSGAIALEIAPCTSMKIDTVAYLKGKEGAGMSWTSICNGLWADWVSDTMFCRRLQLTDYSVAAFVIGPGGTSRIGHSPALMMGRQLSKHQRPNKSAKPSPVFCCLTTWRRLGTLMCTSIPTL